MHDVLRQRLLRKIESLPDEQIYQVLDFIEFLESKYAARAEGGGFFRQVTDTAEDAMRAAGLPLRAITGTMGLVDSAGKVMRGVAAAAQAVVDEAVKAAGPPAPPSRPAPPAGSPPGADTGSDAA